MIKVVVVFSILVSSLLSFEMDYTKDKLASRFILIIQMKKAHVVAVSLLIFRLSRHEI